jgi:hypothetical protein
VAKHFTKDHARVERNIFILITGKSSKQNLTLPRYVLDRWPSCADLPPEEVVEDLYDVFPGFKIKARDVDDQPVQ